MLKNLRNLFRRNKDTEPVQQPIVGIDISNSFVRIVQIEKKKKTWSLVKLISKANVES
jgi:Tfp pilus assembly PilM family ATPase